MTSHRHNNALSQSKSTPDFLAANDSADSPTLLSPGTGYMSPYPQSITRTPEPSPAQSPPPSTIPVITNPASASSQSDSASASTSTSSASVVPEWMHHHRGGSALPPGVYTVSPTNANAVGNNPLSSSTELRMPIGSPDSSPVVRPSSSPSPHPPLTSLALSRTVPWRKKLVLCLVGLPARGKSYIAYKLVGYMRWRGLRAQLFNVGKHRRSAVSSSQDANFFDAANVTATQQRDAIAFEVLESMLDWLQEGGDVSVFDATNTTNKRRWEVFRHCQRRSPVLRVIFVESICDDPLVLESNYNMKCRNSPDYKDVPLEQALADLRLRIKNYERIYEPIQDDVLSYLKLINLNSKVICNKIHGSLGHLISAYLMSIHIQPRPIYLVRTGKCEGEERIPLSQRIADIGSKDSPYAFHMPFTINMAANLTQRGNEFSQRLGSFMQDRAMEYFTRMQKDDNVDPLMNTLANYAAQLGVGREVTDEDGGGMEDADLGGSRIMSPAAMQRGVSRVDVPLIVYTSTLPRAAQTVSSLAPHVLLCEQTSALNMMDTGVLHSLSIDEIKQRYPNELERWHRERYMYRFPGGESQADKARGLESLVMEIERHNFPVLIVSHASTLQVLYGYFLGSSRSVNEYYSLHVPQHFVIELTPNQYGWEEKRWDLRSEEEKTEDLNFRQERLKRLALDEKAKKQAEREREAKGEGDGSSGDGGRSAERRDLQKILLRAESRRGSDRFISAESDLDAEQEGRPRIGTMDGQQPDTITHSIEFYEEK